MSKKAIITIIHQQEVKILSPEDMGVERYENNKLGDRWELIEYPDKTRGWMPVYKYTLTTPKIRDFTGVSIEDVNHE